MPFTPFHFGPALALKAVAPRAFSWTAFVASQVVIDCEPLYYMLRGDYPVHRVLHWFVGATGAGLAAAVACLLVVRLAGRLTPERVVSLRRAVVADQNLGQHCRASA